MVREGSATKAKEVEGSGTGGRGTGGVTWDREGPVN